eukprot:jgi/Tetstr1/434562/TSEL_023653.t1
MSNQAAVAAVVARRRLDAKDRAKAQPTGGLAPEDEDFIGEMFAKYDTDQDGGLNLDEIRRLMTDLNEGTDVDLKTVQQYVNRYDKDKSGTIEKAEVRKLIASWYIAVEDNRSDAACQCVIC